jgi:hypothetical protein
MLLEHGADMNVVGGEGAPRDVALRAKLPEMMTLLEKEGTVSPPAKVLHTAHPHRYAYDARSSGPHPSSIALTSCREAKIKGTQEEEKEEQGQKEEEGLLGGSELLGCGRTDDDDFCGR